MIFALFVAFHGGAWALGICAPFSFHGGVAQLDQRTRLSHERSPVRIRSSPPRAYGEEMGSSLSLQDSKAGSSPAGSIPHPRPLSCHSGEGRRTHGDRSRSGRGPAL